jgi:nitric oxide reductase NorD protein
MAHFLELEQVVGRCWHRWASAAQSYPCHPEAAVALDELHERLAVFYRGLGGPGGVHLAAASRSSSSHRLSLRQRLGLGKAEWVDRPTLDWDTLHLPQHIDCFPERELNEKLYLWLAAYFAHAGTATLPARDPLQADLLALRAAHATTRRVLAHWPGLRGPYALLAEAVSNIRPRRSVTGWEAAVEAAILHLLGADAPINGTAGQALQAIVGRIGKLPAALPAIYHHLTR